MMTQQSIAAVELHVRKSAASPWVADIELFANVVVEEMLILAAREDIFDKIETVAAAELELSEAGCTLGSLARLGRPVQ